MIAHVIAEIRGPVGLIGHHGSATMSAHPARGGSLAAARAKLTDCPFGVRWFGLRQQIEITKVELDG